MKNLSCYIGKIKDAIKTKGLSLENLKSMLSNWECPEHEIEPVINGLIKDLIFDNLLNSGTPNDLLFRRIKENVTNVTEEDVRRVLDYMAKKRWITIDDNTEKVSKGIVPLPNMPIYINF